jgi:hypothetical protein
LNNRQFADLGQLKLTEGITIPCMELEMAIAVDTGDIEKTKFLTMTFGAKYGLYHKQMAMIAGHAGLVLWLEKFGECASKITVFDVHRRISPKTHQITYDDVIPVDMRSF